MFNCMHDMDMTAMKNPFELNTQGWNVVLVLAFFVLDFNRLHNCGDIPVVK